MSQACTIENAVQEIMTGIRAGATLPFSPGVLKALRETYHERLERAESLGIHWTNARGRVMPLAHMVGAVATMLAAADQALTGPTAPPKKIQPAHAWRAAYLVSKVCLYPMDDGIIPPGKICCDMPREEIPGCLEDDTKLAEGLLKIFRILKLVPDSPKS